MSANDNSDAKDDATETDGEMNDDFAFEYDIATGLDKIRESDNNETEIAKRDEIRKKYTREIERNYPLIDKCRALFPVPTTRASCAQQMVGDNNRLAALGLLLEELQEDIDLTAFGL